jgi:chromate transporter
MPIPQKPSFKEALLFWLRLGFISFGGPAGQIAIMHEFLVDKKKWISESRFLHALNYCMLIPGPEAQQLATYTGWLLHGVRGGLAAGILFVLPSVFILLALSIVYALYGAVPWVSALFYGLKPAVVAIVIVALIKIGKRSLKGIVPVIFAAASFTAIFFFNVPFPLVIIAVILLAMIIRQIAPSLMKNDNEEQSATNNESASYINRNTVLTHTGFSWKKLALQVFSGIILWIVPFTLTLLLTSDPSFWKTLSLFFTKAAFITFGGAYAVLPYATQVSVEQYHWLSSLQMIDGLAMGETTPGPLIMVLSFIGFMAGFNHYNGSVLHGTAGLFLTVYYTFLPCFLFIFAGAPLIERTQQNKALKSVMNLITAAVVGVILNLTIYFGLAVVFSRGYIHYSLSFREDHFSIDLFAIAWIIVSFFALYRFRLNMIVWIGISALAGLALYLAAGGSSGI